MNKLEEAIINTIQNAIRRAECADAGGAIMQKADLNKILSLLKTQEPREPIRIPYITIQQVNGEVEKMPEFDEHYTYDDLSIAADVITKLPSVKKNTPRIMAREELLQGWGHGWEEIWFIGDDEDPEEITLVECVWINGTIVTEDGADGHADSDHWKERYGKQYAMRIWGGNTMPTDEQRRETPWG